MNAPAKAARRRAAVAATPAPAQPLWDLFHAFEAVAASELPPLPECPVPAAKRTGYEPEMKEWSKLLDGRRSGLAALFYGHAPNPSAWLHGEREREEFRVAYSWGEARLPEWEPPPKGRLEHGSRDLAALDAWLERNRGRILSLGNPDAWLESVRSVATPAAPAEEPVADPEGDAWLERQLRRVRTCLGTDAAPPGGVDAAAAPGGRAGAGHRYPGGKGQAGVVQRHANMIPPHRVRIVPFAGKCAVTRAIRPAERTVMCDLDPEVVEFWRSLDLPGVEVHQVDGVEFLRAFPWQGGEFVYADPPYMAALRKSKRRIYRHDFGGKDDHRRLLDVLRAVPCPVLLCGYPSRFYGKALRGWRVTGYQARTRGGSAVEAVWCNYPVPPALHDYSYLGSNYREREDLKRKQARWRAKFEGMSQLERYAMLSVLGESVGSAAQPLTLLEAPADPPVAPAARPRPAPPSGFSREQGESIVNGSRVTFRDIFTGNQREAFAFNYALSRYALEGPLRTSFNDGVVRVVVQSQLGVSFAVPLDRITAITPPAGGLGWAVSQRAVDAAFKEWWKQHGDRDREMERNYRHCWREAVLWAELGLPRPPGTAGGMSRQEAWDWRTRLKRN